MLRCRERGRRRARRRHVLANHRAGRRIGVVAHRHRRHERRVDTHLHARADCGPVLAVAVVVGRDRAGAQVRALADVGVADVGEMRDLAPRPDFRVLDLDERARLRPLAQDRPRAQIGERPDGDAVADLRSRDVRVDDLRLVADARVDQRAERPDRRSAPDRRRAVEARERGDLAVGADLDRDVDHGRGRVDDRHAREHVALLDLALGDARSPRRGRRGR